jgi:hypothetical protein
MKLTRLWSVVLALPRMSLWTFDVPRDASHFFLEVA